MATAAEGREGGIGGKIRAKQSRRAPATPYDRPPAAARGLRGGRADAAEEERGSRWLSRLVDPASTLITRGANKLLSSVFRKRLGAPPAEESPGASFEPGQAAPDVCNHNNLPEIQEQGREPLPEMQMQGIKYKDDPKDHSNGDGISELEQLLKQKTFTRAEYDHLTELLHLRTVDIPKEDENKIVERSTLLPASDYKKQGDENLPPQESRIERSKFIGITSTPGPTLKISEEGLASPAEVAKAYMVSRSSKVSPSSLCLRSQMLRETIASPSFIGFAPKSSAESICSKSVVRFSGVPGTLEDGYMTPRLRGRSGIYRMSRSPYFKRQPTITLKDDEPTDGGYPFPSMSTQTPTNIALSTGKQVLKRRSSVLETDLGSIGPIRRIRPKSNLMSPSEDVITQSPGKLLPAANALDLVQKSSSSVRRPLPLHEHKYITSNMKKAENQEERGACASVPLHSREMAEKILQQLDKLVPSPKGESTEAKTISRDESPSKLSLDMLHGRALKNVTKVEASPLFNVEANGKLEGPNNFNAAGPRNSVSRSIDKAENGQSKPMFSETKMSSEVKGVGSAVASIAETRPMLGSVDPVFLHSTVDSLQKSPAFKMQAPEGSLEQEGKSYNGRDISGPSAPGKEIAAVIDHKSLMSETSVTRKTFDSSSASMFDSNIQLSEVAGKGVSDVPVVADKVTGFTFQVSLPSSTECQGPLTPTMPSLPLGEPLSSNEQNNVPQFTFGSKSTPLVFSSSMMSYSDPPGQKFGAGADFKGHFFGSASTTMTMAAPVECTESDDAEKIQKLGYLRKSVGTSSPFGLSTSPTSSGFQFVTSATSSQSNGSPTSKASLFSASSGSAAFLSGSLASTIISAGPPTVSSSISETSNSPAFSALPPFQFGASSSAVSTDSALPVVKSVSTDLEPKLVKDSPFGNTSSSAAVSSMFSSTGSSIFGFSASAASGATTFGCSAGSVFGSQAAKLGSGSSPFAGSTRSQFGSAASASFGLACSSFGFSSLAFASSISSMKTFGSSSGFGPSSTLSPAGATCSSTPTSSSFATTVTTPSVFGSSSQSTVSSIFGSGFGSSVSFSSVSTFGLSSSSSASTSFSSSSVSPFTVSSSAAAMPSVFSFTPATATNSSAFSSTFGATTSAPHSPAVCGSSGNDQMNVEDSMADDMVQAPIPVVPTFGQPANVPTPTSPFGSTPTPAGTPAFQFASSQPSTLTPSQTPFQATGSVEFGGNFSMGSGGGDKSGRRIIKVKRDKHRKK